METLPPAARPLAVQACVVGGGPAGMMLGLLLARAGVRVIVLEKHADFFRDFRGDTIHPSTLELMHELGWLREFLELPHQELARLSLDLEGRQIAGPDFSRLPVKCPFIALIPQWDFLGFLAKKAREFPSFQLEMRAEVTALIEEAGRVVGVRATTPAGPLEVRADVVFGTDGRHSTTRECGHLEVEEIGVPIDVLWYRLGRPAVNPPASLGHMRAGRLMVTIDRGDYFQCASIIPKGALPQMQALGLDAFRAVIASTVPELAAAAAGLSSWDDVKLLTVQINRLRRWERDGLLCLGDAAHAMSPAGGVGINLAIQDAVAAANLLAEKLARGACTTADLHAVQRRREWPVKVTQKLQAAIHRRMFRGGEAALPGPVARALLRLGAPVIRRLAARVVGLGVRVEHIRSPRV